MEIREYDVVLLKSGEEGTILEIFNQEDFLIELINNEQKDINISEIEKVLWSLPLSSFKNETH
jgi:hypothetical protein